MRYFTECALCNKKTELEMSHVVPKMAIRELKKTSVGAVRSARNPNLTVQDSEKHNMLCSNCEDLFCEYETYFAKTIFHPYLRDKADTFRYNEYLTRFIVSISWRSVYLDILDYIENGISDNEALDCLIQSEGIMKEFLLGKRNDLARITNHIFFFDKIKTMSRAAAEEILGCHPHASIRRSITSYTFWYNHAAVCGNITNMLGIFLISLFRSTPDEKWLKTEILNGNGKVEAKNQIIESVVGNEFEFIIKQTEVASKKVSTNQKQKIVERLERVGSRIKDFSIFSDWLDDYDIEIDE